MDTGASRNVINPKLLEPAGELFRFIKRHSTPTTMRLTGVAGSAACEGEVDIEVSIGGHSWSDRFYLLPTCPHAIIIGFPTCRSQEMLMEAASSRLCFRGQRWVDVLSKDEIAVELEREGQAKQQHRLLSCLRSSDHEGVDKKVRWADLSGHRSTCSASYRVPANGGYYATLQDLCDDNYGSSYEWQPVPTAPMVAVVKRQRPHKKSKNSSRKAPRVSAEFLLTQTTTEGVSDVPVTSGHASERPTAVPVSSISSAKEFADVSLSNASYPEGASWSFEFTSGANAVY